MTTLNAPCPVCGANNGFHDDFRHAVVRGQISRQLPQLLKVKGWQHATR